MTIDQAIELLLDRNLDLRAKFMEIPQARADVLTASLRANPIFYADSQLVPYGTNSVQKPDGPTQYDINVSHPIDYSHKRRARVAYASRALKVMEAQYQNEVRLAIGNLYGAFVDVLAAREDIRALRTSIAGLDEVVRIHQELYEKKAGTSADVDQAKSEREIASVGLLDAEEVLQKRKRVLGEILNLLARGSRAARAAGNALGNRAATALPSPSCSRSPRIPGRTWPRIRLGVEAALANVKLQRANRFSDAYLLYQPYTFQNNAPFGKQSGTSWAMGITVPLPCLQSQPGKHRSSADQRHPDAAATGLRRAPAGDRGAAGRGRISWRAAGSSSGFATRCCPGSSAPTRRAVELFQEGEADQVRLSWTPSASTTTRSRPISIPRRGTAGACWT